MTTIGCRPCPVPLNLLSANQNLFRKHLKLSVAKFWEDGLRQESLALQSIKHFDVYLCNLSHPHWIWTTAGNSSYEVRKACILARMVSGRYRTDYFARHWTANKRGFCLVPDCVQQIGDLKHMLIECPALASARAKVIKLIIFKSSVLLPLRTFFESLFQSNSELQYQFILEQFSFDDIYFLCNLYGQTIFKSISYFVRTFAFTIHAERQKLMNARGEA